MGQTIDLPSGLSIAHPLARLRAFLTEEFDFYDGIPSEDPNHISAVDVLATVAVNSGINDAALVRTVQRGMAKACDSLLADTPVEADLRSFDLEAVRRLLHEAVQVPDILVPRAAKVLHRKRRALIPMLDNVLLGHYIPAGSLAPLQDGHAAEAAAPALVAFRADLLAVWDRLSEIRGVLDSEGFPITQLRALEILVWTEVEPRGVYRSKPAG